jgi:hypothetical protein
VLVICAPSIDDTIIMWRLAREKITFSRFSPPFWLIGPKFMIMRPLASGP